MEKFKFRLEGLLKIYRMKEENCKIELGKILQSIQTSKEMIVSLKAHSASLYKSYERAMESSIKGSMLQFLPQEVKANSIKVKLEEQNIIDMDIKYKEKVTELNLARADSKLIGGLKDKRKDAYTKKVKRKEAIELDSMNIIKFKRKEL